MDDARQTAFTLGMGDLAIVEMPRGLTNLAPSEVVNIARAAKPEVLASLTTVARSLFAATELGISGPGRNRSLMRL